MMHHRVIAESLERSGRLIALLVDSTNQETLRRKPGKNKWSILEVLGHLRDEEIHDFRLRLELLMRDPQLEWPPNNPEQLVLEAGHNKRNTNELLAEFVTERSNSLVWIRGLKEPDWGRQKTHPVFGSMRAGDLLYSWAVHDLLHVKQMSALVADGLSMFAGDFSADYAG
jgi:hypothetical protein